METIDKINANEARDRFVATKCLQTLLQKGGSDLQINPTAITDWVDLNCSVINKSNNKLIKFNVEIKERNKNAEQLAKYPNAELKLPKINRIFKATPKGTWAYYMVLLNKEKMLLFNLNKIDWKNTPAKYWTIKKCQMDPNSDYETVYTYFIPYDKADVTLDCSKFYKEYEEITKASLI